MSRLEVDCDEEKPQSDYIECSMSLYKDFSSEVPFSKQDYRSLLTDLDATPILSKDNVWKMTRWNLFVIDHLKKQHVPFPALFPQISLQLHDKQTTHEESKNAISYRWISLCDNSIMSSSSVIRSGGRYPYTHVPIPVYNSSNVCLPINDVSKLRDVYRAKRERVKRGRESTHVEEEKYMDESTTCMVCLDNLDPDSQDISIMPCCKSTLCPDCSHTYLQQNKICMSCRKPLRGYDQLMTAPTSCVATPSSKNKLMIQNFPQGDGMLNIQLDPYETYAAPCKKLLTCQNCQTTRSESSCAPLLCPFEVLGCRSQSQSTRLFEFHCDRCDFDGMISNGQPISCGMCNSDEAVRLTRCHECKREIIYQSLPHDCTVCTSQDPNVVNTMFSEQCEFCGCVHGLIGQEQSLGLWNIQLSFDNNEDSINHNCAFSLPSCSHGNQTLLYLIVAFTRRQLFTKRYYGTDAISDDADYIDHLPWEVFTSHSSIQSNNEDGSEPDWNFVTNLRFELQKLLKKNYPSFEQDVDNWTKRLNLY